MPGTVGPSQPDSLASVSLLSKTSMSTARTDTDQFGTVVSGPTPSL